MAATTPTRPAWLTIGNMNSLTTKAGAKVRIYAFDAGGDYPIHGAVSTGRGWFASAWNEKGHSAVAKGDDIALIPETRTHELWINFYENGTSENFRLRENADVMCLNRIACKRVTIVFEVGEGLDGKA